VRLLPRKLSGSLSARRRSRFAAPVVLLLGLLVSGGAYAAFAPAQADQQSSDASLVAQGRQLFLVGCASCHGQHGEGVVTERGNNYGPPLVGVGAAAVDFQVGTGRMPMEEPGTQALEKAPVYNPKEIEALGAYVASLGPGPAVPTKADYNYKQGDVVKGGQFFLTNCTACHNFAGSGGALPHGRFAPSLRGVSPKHIYEALITGPQQMPVFADTTLSPQAKRDIIAYLKKSEAAPSYGGFSLGALGPVSEGLYAWIAGIGFLVLIAIWIASGTASVKNKKKAQTHE
jgi:ubiquinol-cytochrome c reductase cytochrome c subunit